MKERIPTDSFDNNPPVYVLAYVWNNHNDKDVRRVAPLLRYTHMAIKIGNWEYHVMHNAKPDNGKDFWLPTDVSERKFGKPGCKVYLGKTTVPWPEIIEFSAKPKHSPTWKCYAWLATLTLYRWKKDCVSYTREFVQYLTGIKAKRPQAQTPYGYIKELINCGYKTCNDNEDCGRFATACGVCSCCGSHGDGPDSSKCGSCKLPETEG